MTNSPDTKRLLWSIAKTCEATSLSRSQVWRKVNDPADDFPSPVEVSEGRAAFYADEVLAWIKARKPWRPRKRSRSNEQEAAA